MASTWLRIRFSKAARRSSPVTPSVEGSPAAPSASNCPASSTIETRCGFSPFTAEATTWRIARTCCGSSAPRTRSTIEADGSGVSRENSGRSGSTRWTRAAWIRSIARMVRANSPSSARNRRETQGLEHAVELVNDAGQEAVDEHLRFTRLHLQPQAAGVEGRRAIAPSRIRSISARCPHQGPRRVEHRAPSERAAHPERIVVVGTGHVDRRRPPPAGVARATPGISAARIAAAPSVPAVDAATARRAGGSAVAATATPAAAATLRRGFSGSVRALYRRAWGGNGDGWGIGKVDLDRRVGWGRRLRNWNLGMGQRGGDNSQRGRQEGRRDE